MKDKNITDKISMLSNYFLIDYTFHRSGEHTWYKFIHQKCDKLIKLDDKEEI